MFHIILLILKIIGILLLAVLGLLLLVLLITLLVPIRYQVALEHGEAFFMKGRANWLLHLIHVNFSHMEGVLQIKVRLFGFVVYDNLKPKPLKEKKPKSKTSAKKAKKKKPAKKTSTTTSKSDIKKSEKEQKINVDLNKENLSNKGNDKKPNIANETIIDNNIKKVNTLSNETIRETLVLQKQTDSNKEELLQPKMSETKASFAVNRQETENKEANNWQADKKQADKDKKETIFHKIISKLKSFKEKISKSFQELKAKVINSFMTLKNLRHKISLISEFIKEEINREGLHITYASLKRLLKHILPTKLRSRLVFGTGDPCSTGQALGALGILYSFYGDKIQIIPDFVNSRLEGKHFARGRIRLVTILIIVVKLILDKRFKQLKKNFIILKEAL